MLKQKDPKQLIVPPKKFVLVKINPVVKPCQIRKEIIPQLYVQKVHGFLTSFAPGPSLSNN